MRRASAPSTSYVPPSRAPTRLFASSSRRERSKAERQEHEATQARLVDAEAAAREATKQMAAAASARTQHEVERAALLEAYKDVEGMTRRAASRAEQAESAAAEAATTRDRAVVTLMREEAAREAAEKEALY